MKKCLLLNSGFEPMIFVSDLRALKLFFNNKVEILSNWEEKIYWSSGSMNLPAIIKLKYYVRFIPKRVPFNRLAVFKRDNFVCSYCNDAGTVNTLTIDHIIPKSRNGKTNWLNITTACNKCNLFKDDRTPDEAGLKLLKKPYVPEIKLKFLMPENVEIHDDWKLYLNK